MFKIALALHLLAAVFAVGPLVHAATTAGRGVRQGDSRATAGSARTLRIYAYASVLVIVFGFAVMSLKSGDRPRDTAQFGDTWIWLSTVLWAVAVGLVLAVLVPGLERAGTLLKRQEPAAALAGRLAGTGGAVAMIFTAIILLMVYKPGR